MISDMKHFYNNVSIFITGGTGFVGVCLIEKLLRCCPNLENIYLLIRSKKGKQANERIEELTKNSVFDRLKEEKRTDLFKKLIAVSGDVGQENLGLSLQDRATLINAVQIVFHSAASLDFDADLRATTNINLLGTRRIVQLCQEMKKLKALVHVSSAFVNSYLMDVNEVIYPAPADVSKFLKLVDELDDAALNIQTSQILKDHTNAYTFTKHLAEHEIQNGKVPAAIVRPSMITTAWKEPVPGWTISKNGPQGFLMGASKGIVRRLPVSLELIYDYIPVDIVINSLIVAAYSVERDSNKGLTRVYHCTSSTCNPFRYKYIQADINNLLHEFPLQSAVWYPYIKFLPSILLFKISAIFIHFIPAYILDAITRLSGGRPILVRLHTNVNKSLNLLEKFIFNEWKFDNSRMLELHESLSPEDQELFTLDIRSLNWHAYFRDLTQGIRRYLNKESPKSLARARFKDKMLLVAHLGLQAALLGLIWWLIKIFFSTTWTKTGLVVPLTYLLFNQL